MLSHSFLDKQYKIPGKRLNFFLINSIISSKAPLLLFFGTTSYFKFGRLKLDINLKVENFVNLKIFNLQLEMKKMKFLQNFFMYFRFYS